MENLFQPDQSDLAPRKTGDMVWLPPGFVDFSDPGEEFPPGERTLLEQSWFESPDDWH